MADPRVEEVTAFALSALPAMQLDDGAFCHEVVLSGERRSGGRLGRGPRAEGDGGPQRFGRSLRYTLMVLIGASRARAHGIEPGFDFDAAARAAREGASELLSSPGDSGLVLWADAVGDPGIGAEEALDSLSGLLAGPNARAIEGHELAWAVIGTAEHILSGRDGGEEAFERAAGMLAKRGATPSRLLAHAGSGPRARFPHFADQIYGVLALARAAEVGERGARIAAARAVADALLAHQRPLGCWPWLYDVETGRVVEPFRLYSVHQDAMAPMALLPLARLTGDERYRDAARRGLDWIWSNESGGPLLDRNAGMLYRSINRSGARDRALLWANTLVARFGGRPLGQDSLALEVERTDRPYHLGWVLEAWSGCKDGVS